MNGMRILGYLAIAVPIPSKGIYAPCMDIYGPRPIATAGWIRTDGHNC